jgi:hypothetical protein
MTLQKKLKKTIRARSEKTGESYTAARRQVLLAREKKAETPEQPASVAVQEPPVAPPIQETPAPATKPPRGQVTDEAARQKTGHGLDHWFAVLDAFGAATKGHTAAAAHLHEDHGVPGWYAQGITVAYERARGLRDVNQSCTGTFQVSVSKTVPATVADVIDALKSPERRAAWLQDADPGLVQALDAAFTGDKPREVKTKNDYAWLRFPWDGRTVEIRITGKPKGASVVADNSNLPDPALIEQRRAQWKVALAGLQKHLGG